MFLISYVYNIFLFDHTSWLQIFQLFQFSFFQVNSVNNFEDYVIFQDLSHQLQKRFYEIFLKLKCNFKSL